MTSEEAKRRGAMGRGRRKTLTPEQREACRIRLAASRANRHPNNGKWVLSFSGGKDSLAILHVILRDNLPLDRVVTFLSDWEFPQLLEHLAKVERMTGIAITRVGPRVSWWQMRDRWGWPYAHCRWCSGDKGATIDRETKGCNKYVGLAADEAHRAAKYMRNGISHKVAFPLIDKGLTQKDTLAMCRSLGYDWGGMYDHWTRPSCYCCPLQPVEGLRKVRLLHPDLWADMVRRGKGDRFKCGKPLEWWEERFANDARQQCLEPPKWHSCGVGKSGGLITRATTGICARLAATTPPVKVLPRCFSVPSPMGGVTQKKRLTNATTIT